MKGLSNTLRPQMREPTRTYRIAMAVNLPVARWGRLEVSGVETLPASGPLLLIGNHDSHWDPVMIGHAARKRRMVRALAKSTLWDVRGLNKVLDGMGQIPIVRGAGDAKALANAVTALREGSCVGVFPEGTRSKGRVMRARSGVGRLALEVPEAHVSPGRRHRHRRPHRLPPPPEDQGPLLRPGRRPAARRRGSRRAIRPPPGRDPRDRPADARLPQARQGHPRRRSRRGRGRGRANAARPSRRGGPGRCLERHAHSGEAPGLGGRLRVRVPLPSWGKRGGP